ncbi:MAG TPA: hypothetical protein DCM68_04965 [Verrucomicrobia bacterium]|nr:hypothetical protein [Verrucomicrobiota bacterium]
MKHRFSKWNAPGPALAGFLIALVAAAQAWGWTEEVRNAAGEVASGQASEAAQRASFENNQAINRMGARGPGQGGVPKDVYTANQNAFTAKNNEFIRDAARKCGLEVDIKGPRVDPKTGQPDPLAGTDTDVNVRTKDGKPLTYDQWKRLNDTYTQNVNEYLKKPPGSKVNTGTDLMPDPATTPPETFKEITRTINEQGGTTYSDPAAARIEAAMASKGPVTVNEVGGYVKELQTQANAHFDQAARTTAEANAKARALGENHPEVQDLRAKAQIENSQGAKYIDKITDVGAKIREQAGVAAPKGQTPPSSSLTEALRNNRGADTIAQSEQIGPLAQNALNNATRGAIEDLGRVAAANPEAAPACQQAIADSLRDLTMSQKGQAMDMLKTKFGNQFAQGVAAAAQGPTAGAQVMKGFDKVMKVIGPGLMVWDGYHRITGALNAPDEAKTYVAGKAAGGFIGGLGGAAAVGLGVAAVLGAPVTAVGAAAVIGASVVAGAVGYGVGDYAGTSLAGWMLEGVRPRDQSEYDALAAKGLLEGGKDIYGQLIAAGVPADVAQAAADAYKRGDVKTFREILAAVRSILVKDAKKIPVRRFADLPKTEVQALLNCLCSASLGANPWVAQGYNTTIPPDADPKKHSCGSLANGPCMAQGFGCWRSFIKWSNPGIADCLASFNLPTNSGFVRGQIDAAHQKEFEKPFTVKLDVSPTEVCPGDKVQVNVICEGGRGDYQYRYDIGWPLQKPPDAPKNGWTPTSSSSLALTVDPTLKRGFYDGRWVYTRPAEAYNAGVWVTASSTTWDPVSQQETVVTAHQVATVHLRPHHECEKLNPPKPSETEKPPKKTDRPPKKTTPSQSANPPGAPVDSPTAPVKKPTSSSPPAQMTGASAGAGQQVPSAPPPPPARGDKPSSPPPSSKPGKPLPPTPGEKATPPSDSNECWAAGSGYGTPETGNTFIGEVRAGRKVRLTISGPAGHGTADGVTQASLSFPYVAGDYTMRVEDLHQPGCVTEEKVSIPPAGAGTNAPSGTATGSNDCASCLSIGGSAAGSGASLTDAAGQTTARTEASAIYWVEGCPGQKVRLTVKGSDGWTGSAEAENQRASVARPVGMASGTDEILAENLSIPGCSRTMHMPFGPPPEMAGTNMDNCAVLSGGASGQATSLTDATGSITASQQASAWYRVEGPARTKVRLAVKGSDGWTGSAEGDEKAELTRPIGTESGTDSIVYENLSIPGCRKTAEIPFGPPPADLKGSELPAEGGGAMPTAGTQVLGGLVGTAAGKADKKMADGLAVMGGNAAIQEASNVGNQTIQDAKNTLNSGGQAAQDIRDKSQQKIQIEEGKDAHPFATAILEGVGSGLSQAGQQFGAGLGEGVAGEIFDPHHSPSGDGVAKAGASTGAVAPASEDSHGAGSAPASSGTKKKPGGGAVSPPATTATAPASEGQILADALCPVCGQMYNPAVGHPCPGSQEILADALCPVCGQMYNPVHGHSCPGAAQEPGKTVCEICGKSPAISVSTVDAGSKRLCSACQGYHRCPQCGKYAMEFHGAGYNYGATGGPSGSGYIEGVCSECLAKWKREHNLP